MKNNELIGTGLVVLACVFSGQAQWETHHSMDASEFADYHNTLTDQGMRLTEVRGFSVNGSPVYVAMWEDRGGPLYSFLHDMTDTDLDANQGQQMALGYRPVLLDRYDDAGADRYLAIWEKWMGPDRIFDKKINLSDLSTQLATRVSEGHRPLRLDVAPGTSGLAVTALWEQRDSPERKVLWGLLNSTIDQELQAQADMGFRPVQISSYQISGIEYSLVILEKSPGRPWIVRTGKTSAEYQTEFDTLLISWFRPVSISGYELNGEERYSAIWTQFERPDPPASPYPVSGLPQPSLETLDSTMVSYMRDRNISAGALSIAVGDTIVYEKGFGWQDDEFQRPLRRSALFRVADLSKPVTAAAVRKLATDGALDLNAHVFDQGQPGGGILDLVPAGIPDGRLKDITVLHLLGYASGWNPAVSGDPMLKPYVIAEALGVAMPPSQKDIARWVAGQPLDSDPGTYAYSNLDYMLLGLVIEEVTGMDATAWIRANIMQPMGVPPEDFQLARTLPEDRDAREPDYYDLFLGSMNVYHPDQQAHWPDGAHHFESFETHGGWIFTTRTYLKFLQNYWLTGIPRDQSSLDYYTWGYLQGTLTLARQLPGGVSYVAFFNQSYDRSSGLDYFVLPGLLDAAIADVTEWPTTDPASVPPLDPQLAIQQESPGVLELNWTAEEGRVHQLFYSRDVNDFEAEGVPVLKDSTGPVSADISGLLNGDEQGYFYVETE